MNWNLPKCSLKNRRSGRSPSWRFKPSLCSNEQTALQRGKVRLILSKIARSVDIKNRYGRLVDTEATLDRREDRLQEIRGPSDKPDAGAEPEPAGIAAQRFDGLGRLARVVSAKPEMPSTPLSTTAERWLATLHRLRVSTFGTTSAAGSGSMERPAILPSVRHATLPPGT